MKTPKPYSVSLIPAEDFKPQIDVVGCILECGAKILLVYRHKDKPYGETWGLPSGKLEKNENPIDGLIREIDEETGIILNKNTLLHVETFFIKRVDTHLTYRLYRSALDSLPIINLSLDENTLYKWATIEEALAMDLITGAIEVLSFYKEKILNQNIIYQN